MFGPFDLFTSWAHPRNLTLFLLGHRRCERIATCWSTLAAYLGQLGARCWLSGQEQTARHRPESLDLVENR
jgi:hypothetical protein